MALIPGTRLDHYEILGLVGAGGMGQVHRARDTKLNRDVAIKVLIPTVASDADRLARFTREAQVLAALNHPNIAQIHGVSRCRPRLRVARQSPRWSWSSSRDRRSPTARHGPDVTR